MRSPHSDPHLSLGGLAAPPPTAVPMAPALHPTLGPGSCCLSPALFLLMHSLAWHRTLHHSQEHSCPSPLPCPSLSPPSLPS